LSVVVDTLDQRQIPVAGIWLSGAEFHRGSSPTEARHRLHRASLRVGPPLITSAHGSSAFRARHAATIRSTNSSAFGLVC
jgi:hypothetical protein